jgi:hypothetical protein
MTVWESVTWDVARAGGFTAYILLALSVALGLALTLHWQSNRWPRLINSEMHNFTTLVSLMFTGLHVLAVWVDPFTRFGWNEVFIPLASHYRPLWMAFGIVALYLGLAIGLSTWLRPIIGYAWWRRLHIFTLVAYALVTIHGIATGSDTRTWWGLAIYAASAAMIAWLLLLRLLQPATAQARAHPGWAVLTALLLIAGMFWTVLGPLQADWNATANNGQGSGSRVALANGSSTSSSTSTPSSSGGTLAIPFSSSLTGTLTQSGPDASRVVRYTLSGTFQDGTTGQVSVQLTGQTGAGGFGNDSGVSIIQTSVTLGTASNPTLYSGQVTGLRASTSRWRITAAVSQQGSSANSITIRLSVSVGSDTTAQGTISASSAGSGL